MKFPVRLVMSLLVLVITGCGSIQRVQTPMDQPSESSVIDVNQGQDNSAILSPKNLNAAAFKNMGDLAFIWEGLLFTLDGKTGEVKQLTYSRHALHPIWSNDGEWLAFISADGPSSNSGQLWLVRKDGQQAHQVQGINLEQANDQNLSWSPTTNILAVSGKEGLWLVPSQGEPTLKFKGLLSYAYCPWSPDGKSIAYNVMNPPNNQGNRDDDLYTLNVNSGETVKYITAENAGIKIATWLPDGSGLLYWLDPLHSASLAADGLELWSLKFNDVKPKLVSTGLAYRDWLSFSPNGQLLMVSGGGRIIWAQKSLIISSPESGSTLELPNPADSIATDPSFSPNGSLIAFVAAKSLGNEVWGFSKSDDLANWVATRVLWIENADGSAAHPLQSAGTGVYQPVWSKDGTHIVYVQNNSLWIIGAKGENPEKILGPFSDWKKDQFGYYGYIRQDDFAWFKS
ncbi:PD40 domain-containing protein [Desulfosporosinus sp. OT]|uniref:PD40 domain-containing protein n=1 Tax=Desulfosporosinus sp. OT TaxID=913865 RepID=UPI000223A0BF|nr:PD40 domain-containing protein [Desulfosporosinus sp. OT]EGW35880.1 WD40-like Beta Propeller Repeat family protein [Desulfosporosinus sp. OT]